jgi:hypothetical protein
MTSVATKYYNEIRREPEYYRRNAKAALLAATTVFSVVCQSPPLSAADSPRDLTGEWEFLSNTTEGTLTIDQIRSGFRCNELTGTIEALDVVQIVGLYCPDDLHITFAPLQDGADAPLQIYEGYVSQDGQTMAGKVSEWGNGAPQNQPTTPFVGSR